MFIGILFIFLDKIELKKTAMIAFPHQLRKRPYLIFVYPVPQYLEIKKYSILLVRVQKSKEWLKSLVNYHIRDEAKDGNLLFRALCFYGQGSYTIFLASNQKTRLFRDGKYVFHDHKKGNTRFMTDDKYKLLFIFAALLFIILFIFSFSYLDKLSFFRAQYTKLIILLDFK